jgi:hypothetical protein
MYIGAVYSVCTSLSVGFLREYYPLGRLIIESPTETMVDFRRTRSQLRRALKGIRRYIATPMIAKHKIFTFLEENIIPDQKLVAIALNDAYFLGVLSSKVHVNWALAAEVGWELVMTQLFKNNLLRSLPLPQCHTRTKTKIRNLG